jgi:hypothetical protein
MIVEDRMQRIDSDRAGAALSRQCRSAPPDR